jgi:hypothetical protein
VLQLKARTALAAQIAGIDRQRFNEAVAEGFYPCAPPTTKGATRHFDLNDIVTLTVYRELTQAGAVPRAAGAIACGLRDLLRQFPDCERAVYVVPSLGGPAWQRAEDFNYSATHFDRGENMSADIVHFTEWRLHVMRERIAHYLEKARLEASSVVGEEYSA